MFGDLTKSEFLLALHDYLYLSENNLEISGDKRLELYMLLEQRHEEFGNREKGYIESLITEGAVARARNIIEDCGRRNIKISTWYDDDYIFGGVCFAPPVVFIKGKFPDPLKNPYIAVVGSRKASDYGRKMVKYITQGLTPYRPTIVSGLAYGIDASAHNAALDAGLPTVAILGCGINVAYPASNQGLAGRISENGAVVSEFPWDMKPLKWNFPMRNRVISGLSMAVVVVEGEIKSGSLITARWAADQGKEVFAVPGTVGRPLSTGTNRLIKDGAHLLESGKDIAAALHLKKYPQKKATKISSGQNVDHNVRKSVLNFLKRGGSSLEDLVEETGLDTSELLKLVTQLEVTGEGRT